MMKTLRLILVLSFAILYQSATAQLAAPATREQFSVFPQPAGSELTLSFGNADLHAADVKMYDLLGNLVSEFNADRFEDGIFTIYIGDKKPGYYFLKVFTEDGTFSRRITIKP